MTVDLRIIPKFGELEAYTASISLLILIFLNMDTIANILLHSLDSISSFFAIGFFISLIGYSIVKAIDYAISHKVPDRTHAGLFLVVLLSIIALASLWVSMETMNEIKRGPSAMFSSFILIFPTLGLFRSLAIMFILRNERHNCEKYFDYRSASIEKIILVTVLVVLVATVGIFLNFPSITLFLAMTECSRFVPKKLG